MSVIFDGDAPALICWQCRRYHGYFSKWVSLGMHSLALYRDHGLASWSSQTLSRSYCTFQSMNIGPHWGTAVAYTVQTAEAAVRGWRHRLRALQALTTASACTSTETVHLFSLFATRTYCNPHGVHGEEPKMRPLFFFFAIVVCLFVQCPNCDMVWPFSVWSKTLRKQFSFLGIRLSWTFQHKHAPELFLACGNTIGVRCALYLFPPIGQNGSKHARQLSLQYFTLLVHCCTARKQHSWRKCWPCSQAFPS